MEAFALLCRTVGHFGELKRGKKSPEVEEYILQIVCILSVIFFLKTDSTDTFGSDLPEPFIEVPNITNLSELLNCQSYTVFVDGKMCSASHFIKAFKLYMSSCYVFNIEFPPSLSHTFYFLEKVLIKTKPADTKNHQKQSDLLTQLEMQAPKQLKRNDTNRKCLEIDSCLLWIARVRICVV